MISYFLVKQKKRPKFFFCTAQEKETVAYAVT